MRDNHSSKISRFYVSHVVTKRPKHSEVWRLFEERHLLESGAFSMRVVRGAALIRMWCLFEAQPFLEHRIHPPPEKRGEESLK